MEDRAFRKYREMPSNEKPKDESLVKPLQLVEARNSPSEQEESHEEKELTDAPTTRGRMSQEL